MTLVDLTDVLPPAHLLAVVTAATAGGKELTPEELRKVGISLLFLMLFMFFEFIIIIFVFSLFPFSFLTSKPLIIII